METVEKLHIKNFAGIKDMEFEFKPINILIGPQGVGKSIVIKLVYFFKTTFSKLNSNVELNKDEILAKAQSDFMKRFPLSELGDESFRIIYTIANNTAKVTKRKNKIILDFPDQIDFSQTSHSGDFKDSFYNLYSKLNSFNLFIPAGRSFFSLLQDNIFYLSQNNDSIDSFILDFGIFYQNIRRGHENKFIDLNEKLFENIINAVYLREFQKDYLVYKDNRKVNVLNTSSGEQEVLPLLLILQYLYGRDVGSLSMFIEEPEAHLFPLTQKKIIELLALTYNNNPFSCQLFITTHSPYILSSFNNLIYAGNLTSKFPELKTEINKIVDEKLQLTSDLFSVYSLDFDNKESLMDKDTDLISSTVIDSVSEEISSQFDSLLNIEFKDELQREV